MEKEMTFLAAMKDFFGYRPGNTAADFMKEIRALDDKSRAFFKSGLEQNGYKIILS